ncbi:MAG: hypothetical protein EPO16_10595 [Dehalococcoidia bacterium]|nr:MAG: hypothetical protein EPO16_10595 [Dehalococcoidia bacterium]
MFRTGNDTPMAIGKLFAGRAASSLEHVLLPRCRLAPGRYDMMFARYGVRWPVTLAPVEDGEPHTMLVRGRVPL